MKQMKRTYIVPQIKTVNLGLFENLADVELPGTVVKSNAQGVIEPLSHGGGDEKPPFTPLKTNVWEDDW